MHGMGCKLEVKFQKMSTHQSYRVLTVEKTPVFADVTVSFRNKEQHFRFDTSTKRIVYTSKNSMRKSHFYGGRAPFLEARISIFGA